MSARRNGSVLLTAVTLILAASQARAGGGGKLPYVKAAPQQAPGTAPQQAAGAQQQAQPRPAGAASPGAVRAASADELSFGEPIRYHNVSVVPVGTTRKGPFQKYTLLEQGLKDGTLAVREMAGSAGAAQVSQIEVMNSGHEPVYLLGGEMILGGKQDRIIQQDTVLAPSGKWAQVAVFCVERGRWEGQNMAFSAGGAMAHVSLRSAAMSGSQSEVWAEVARNNLRHGTQSQTETYRRTIQNADLRGRIEPYRKQLTGMLPGDQQLAGFVLAINGDIRVADLFGNPVLFKDLQDKLLSSYILEGLGTSENRAAPALTRGGAEGWLMKARAAKKGAPRPSGSAVNYSKDSGGVVGAETIDAQAGQSVRETYMAK